MKPAYLYAKIAEDNMIVLKWKWYGSTYDVAGFKIERRAVDVLDFTTIGTTNNYIFQDKEIQTDQKASYIYRVHAFKGTDVSGFSNEVRIDCGKEEIADATVKETENTNSQIKPTGKPGTTPLPAVLTPQPTATPITKTKPGTIWMVPDSLQVQTGTYFTTSIRVNTGEQKLAAYGIIIEYSDALLDVNRDIGKGGVIAGSDGFVAAVNARDPGVLFISGMNAQGVGPLDNLHLVTIQWKALSDGVSKFALSIRDMTDEKTNKIKNNTIINGMVSIIPSIKSTDSVVVYNDSRWTEESGDYYSDGREEDQGDTIAFRDNRNTGDYHDAGDYGNNYERDPYDPDNDYPDDPYNEGISHSKPRITSRPTAPPVDEGGRTSVPVKTAKPTASPKSTSTPTPEPTDTPTPNRTDKPTSPPNDPPGTGKVWIEPSSKTASVGQKFSMEIHVNTGNQKLGAYGMRIVFNDSIIELDKGSGKNGVSPGSEGFVAVANSNIKGEVNVAGFDAAGKKKDSDLHLLNVHFLAKSKGTASVRIYVNDLVDDKGVEVGNPSARNGSVTVK